MSRWGKPINLLECVCRHDLSLSPHDSSLNVSHLPWAKPGMWLFQTRCGVGNKFPLTLTMPQEKLREKEESEEHYLIHHSPILPFCLFSAVLMGEAAVQGNENMVQLSRSLCRLGLFHLHHYGNHSKGANIKYPSFIWVLSAQSPKTFWKSQPYFQHSAPTYQSELNQGLTWVSLIYLKE